MLIKCPECNKEVSDVAENCPSCGFPLKSKEPTGLPCPRCKKNTLFIKRVDHTHIPGKTKTSVSLNLNPLKPFTVYNVKEKEIRQEQNIERTLYKCSSCGVETFNPNKVDNDGAVLCFIVFSPFIFIFVLKIFQAIFM